MFAKVKEKKKILSGSLLSLVRNQEKTLDTFKKKVPSCATAREFSPAPSKKRRPSGLQNTVHVLHTGWNPFFFFFLFFLAWVTSPFRLSFV